VSKLGRVAYQGVPGSYSHEACLTFAPDWAAVPFDTFEEAYAAVVSGACERGLFPIENSNAGEVPDSSRLLAASGLRVLSEHPMRIRLQLMALPDATLDGIERVTSHPIALAQCRKMLAELGLEVEPHFDTAGSARDLARSGDHALAAVASRTAAELYGLEILRPDVEDTDDNTTRFLFVAK
jgi:prephenate dehydratase